MGEKSRREYERRGSGKDTHRCIVTDDEPRGEAALLQTVRGPRSSDLEPRMLSLNSRTESSEGASPQKMKRNPSWMNRWKFDCPVALRLIRPKSADVVDWL